MQAVYQWQVSGSNLKDIEDQFSLDPNAERADFGYFRQILHGVPAEIDTLDPLLCEAAGRGMEHVDPVERAILRNACYELAHRKDVPSRVVINEAVDLAKKFGAEQGHVFVNATLDRTARVLRSTEFGELHGKAGEP